MAVTALILSALPLMLVSFYARPMFDDFSFGEGMHNRGFAGLWQTIVSFWQGWQGSFTGTLMMGLQPAAVADPSAYVLTGFVMLGLLGGAVFCLVYAVLGNLASRSEKAIIASALCFACVQWVPYLPHAFFWWNGAIYYTGSFSLMVFLLVALMKRKNTWLLCVTAFLLGGTNYVTTLIFLLILMTTLFFQAFGLAVICSVHNFFHSRGLACLARLVGEMQKLNHNHRPYRSKITFMFLFALGGFLLSALAPGNSMRAGMLEGLDPIRTIYHSLLQGITDIAALSNWPLFFLLLSLSPLFFRVAKRSGFSFPYPAIVFAYSFLLLSAHNAPMLYAMGAGAASLGRVYNVMHYSLAVLLFGNVFYVCGYFAKRYPDYIAKYESFLKIHVFFAALFIFASLIGVRQMSGAVALNELISGRPQEFARVFDMQHELLSKPGYGNVAIPPNTVITPVFTPMSNSRNPANEMNMFLALFYGKCQVAMYENGYPPNFSPEFLPEPAVLRIVSRDSAYYLEIDSFWNRFSINDILEQLEGTGLSFDVSVNILQGRQHQPRLQAGPRELDGFARVEITVNGRRFIRQIAFLAGEPHLTRVQLSGLFGVDWAF